ncbi:TetR/AcrR family transcriptional regulator [Nocardioides sp.]|uniref:TetR/AcrR family transcriptional regulator n=1 Tax=Nocardioides sp. TaxID=35761 RepID=UPI0035AF2AAC
MPRPPGHGPEFDSRREQIIDQAAALFATRGYAATGTADLCREVGLGKGAFYHYIDSKETLLVEIQNRVLGPLLEEAERLALLDQPALVRLRLLSQHLLDVIFSRLEHIWVYEHDYRHLSKENRQRVLEQRHQFERQVTAFLQDAITSGQIEDADARLLMLQFLNMHNHTYQWARPGSELDPDTLSATYFATLMGGFGAKPTAIRRAESAARQVLVSERIA